MVLNHLLLVARRGVENNKIMEKKNAMQKIQNEIEEIQKKMAEQISESKNVLFKWKLKKWCNIMSETILLFPQKSKL